VGEDVLDKLPMALRVFAIRESNPESAPRQWISGARELHGPEVSRYAFTESLALDEASHGSVPNPR
jgi:hypothetical protein